MHVHAHMRVHVVHAHAHVVHVLHGCRGCRASVAAVADLSRNEEGVVKNNFCTRKQLEITISFVSLFGGHIVLFPFLSTAMCVKDNADAVLRRRHLPHPGVLHGHGPRPRAQRHAETRVVSRVTCPVASRGHDSYGYRS